MFTILRRNKIFLKLKIKIMQNKMNTQNYLSMYIIVEIAF